MMKIVTITTSIIGGAGIAAYRLHASLSKIEGITSNFIQSRNNPYDDSLLNVTNLMQTRSLEFKLRRKLNLTPEILNDRKIPAYSTNYEVVTFPTTSFRIEDNPMVKNADIVHLHWVANFVNFPTFFKKIKQPIIWTLHDMNAFQGLFHYQYDMERNHEEFGKIDQETLRLKVKAIHKNKNIHIVCPSEWMMEKSMKSLAFSNYPHYLIPNGIDFSQYPILDKQAMKKELNVDNGSKTILFVAHGTHVYRKGFDILLDAINKLDDVKFNLISVGKGYFPCKDEINHIHFEQISDIKHLNKIYTAADITILPSREDNLPNVMIESMANGTPVISFKNGGMAEHIKTGDTGILAENINSESLKEAINDFLNGKYDFEREKIRNYAEKHFTNSRQVQKYIELYTKVLTK